MQYKKYKDVNNKLLNDSIKSNDSNIFKNNHSLNQINITHRKIVARDLKQVSRELWNEVEKDGFNRNVHTTCNHEKTATHNADEIAIIEKQKRETQLKKEKEAAEQKKKQDDEKRLKDEKDKKDKEDKEAKEKADKDAADFARKLYQKSLKNLTRDQAEYVAELVRQRFLS